MQNFLLKIKLIFIPYLLICIAVTALSCLLNWLLLIKFSAGWNYDSFIIIAIPIVIALSGLLIFLRPRLLLLNLHSSRGSLMFVYIYFAVIFLTIISVIAQQLTTIGTGKLSKLNNISQITQQVGTKYYTVKQGYVDKKFAAANYETTVTGKGNSTLNFIIYIACPVYSSIHAVPLFIKNKSTAQYNEPGKHPLIIVDDKPLRPDSVYNIDKRKIVAVTHLQAQQAMLLYGERAHDGAIIILTVNGNLKNNPRLRSNEIYQPEAWVCVKYEKSVSNNLSKYQKEMYGNEHARYTQQQFNKTNFQKFTYIERIWHGQDHDKYVKIIKTSSLYTLSTPVVILEEKTTPYSERFGSKPKWLLISFAASSVIFLLMIVSRGFKTVKKPRAKRAKQSTYNKLPPKQI